MNRNLHNAVRCVDGKRERDDFKVLVFVGEREREREREREFPTVGTEGP